MVSRSKLIIIGASGHGKVVADIAIAMGQWESISFLDDDTTLKESMGLAVIGSTQNIEKFSAEYDIFIGIGNSAIRKLFYERLLDMSASIPTLVHPNAVIGNSVMIGRGTAIMPGVVINCCTNIGEACIINTSSSLDHDNVIGDYVHISPGVITAGGVTVGSNTWIGMGATIINNIHVESGCTIGAGAVITKNLYTVGTYIGIPAKLLKEDTL